MHALHLLCVGAMKTPWMREGCEDYAGRIGRSWKFSVRDVSASKQKDPAKQAAEESERIIAALEKTDGIVWVCDERGERMTSEVFAKALSAVRDRGDPLTLVLGGAHGFDDRVRRRADRIIRLSDMTLPHELARVVLLEQVYRAGEMIAGRGYHHA